MKFINHKLSLQILAISLGALSLSHCSKNPAPSVAPLSASEKAEVLEIVKSTVRSVGAVNVARKNQNVNALNMSTLGLVATAESTDDGARQLADKLGSCALQEADALENKVSNLAENGNGTFSMASTEANPCPVTINGSFNFSELEGGQKVAAGGSFNYSVSDDSYRKLNDVDSFSMNFSLEGNVQESDKSATATLSSKIHSQSRGDITLDGTLKASGNSAAVVSEMQLTLKTSGLTAVFLVKSNFNQQTEKVTNQFFLNGEELTPAEIEAIEKALGTQFGEDSPVGSAPAAGVGQNPQPAAGPQPASGNASTPPVTQSFLGSFENQDNVWIDLLDDGVAAMLDSVTLEVKNCTYTMNGLNLNLNCEGATLQGTFNAEYSVLTLGGQAFNRL